MWGIMKYQLLIAALLLLALSAGSAQVASHAPALKPEVRATVPSLDMQTGRVVARVNGAVLTERDLMRELYAIFPYARQHNGIPKSMEPEMRKGALDMIVFEELVYQDAERRKMTIPAERLKRAETEFRKQFATQQEFDQVLKAECNGSRQVMREKIRRSLLIEALLKVEVADKAKVSLLQAKTYYDGNPNKFKRPETFSIQTISILPPENGGAEVQKEARKRAEDALRAARATKNYQEFGLLAEKVSEDDWRVNMGDRKAVDRAKLPPEVVKTALAMKPGQVSDLIQLDNNYTLFRLNAHTPAGKVPFEEVKNKLRTDLEKARSEKLRAALYKKLRQNAKVEEL
jgi:parvulin-like peptidyl-prolyl isomerase